MLRGGAIGFLVALAAMAPAVAGESSTTSQPPTAVLILERASVEKALLSLDAPPRFRSSTLRVAFAAPPRAEVCDHWRAYAVPNPDVFDPRTGLCRPPAFFAAVTPIDGVCFGFPRYRARDVRGFGDGLSAEERAVTRAFAQVPAISGRRAWAPTFIFELSSPTSLSPYLMSASRIVPADFPNDLVGVDVYGYRAPALTSAEGAAISLGVPARDGGLSLAGAETPVVILGPFRLESGPTGIALRPIEAQGDAREMVAARLGRPIEEVSFAQIESRPARLCPPLTATGEKAAAILAGRR